jgi:hypothetical protein
MFAAQDMPSKVAVKLKTGWKNPTESPVWDRKIKLDSG